MYRQSSSYLIELCVKGIQINKEVYPSIGKGGHAAIMVCCRINMVDTYSIRPQICHQARVERTLFCVSERILICELIGNAWILVSA